jgi:ATP-dependent protease ClpP protease subunit
MNTLFPVIKEESNYINISEKHTRNFDVFLDEEITLPSDYRELISILFGANEDDTINLFFNSPGGNLDTALSIIEAINHTKATVSAILLGACHSAASMIMLYCHNVFVTNSSYMMIHTASYGSSGNTSNVKAHTDFTFKQVDKLLDDTYEGFLTKEELLSVKKGVELWLNAEEIELRIQKRYKTLKKRMKKQPHPTCEIQD